MPQQDNLAVELDVLAARAGIDIPHARRGAILEGFAEMKRLAILLRSVNLGPGDEPANIYTFANIARGDTK